VTVDSKNFICNVSITTLAIIFRHSERMAWVRLYMTLMEYNTTVYLHHMNWIQGRRPSLDINIIRTRRSFSSHFCWCACYTNMCTCTNASQISTSWPLSNGSTVNMFSRTLILSSGQSLPSGKSPHVCLR